MMFSTAIFLPCLMAMQAPGPVSGLAAQPLRIANVIRMGLPPYEENAEKLYRLEGLGCGELKKGDELALSRPGAAHLRLGKLKIILVRQDHALAKLTGPGDTYPLKGDLAVRAAELKPLPEPAKPAAASSVPLAKLAPQRPSVSPVPPQAPGPIKAMTEAKPLSKIGGAPVPVTATAPVSSSALAMPPAPPVSSSALSSAALTAAQPGAVTAPPAVPKRELHRGVILFRKGSAHLTPGAVKKIALWFSEWGREGAWALLRPVNDLPSQINAMRYESIRDELVKLGVEQVELRDIPAQATAKYDSVYIVLER